MNHRSWLRAYVEEKVPLMTPDQCFVDWPFGSKTKGRPTLTVEGRRITTTRYAWFVLHGEWPKMNMNHTCHNGPCWNPHHLYDGTQQENVRDMWEAGRANPWRCSNGTHPNSKLTQEQVREMRESYASGGITYAALGKKYGTTAENVSMIIKRRTWRDVV